MFHLLKKSKIILLILVSLREYVVQILRQFFILAANQSIFSIYVNVCVYIQS